jgi:hypothetical protein
MKASQFFAFLWKKQTEITSGFSFLGDENKTRLSVTK